MLTHLLFSLFFLLLKASKLQTCIFDKCDIETALKMEIEEPIDYALKYFLFKRFEKDNEKAAYILLNTPEDNIYANLIICRSNEIENYLEIPIRVKNNILANLASNIAKEFFFNKYQFKDLVVLDKTISPLEIKDVLINIWTLNPQIIAKFFIYIETRDLKLENVVNEIEFLAKNGEKQANCLLGTMYSRGIGVPKNLDKALEHLWYSGVEDSPVSYVALARAYMEDEILNIPLALQYIHSALKTGANPEASYCQYIISLRNNEKDLDALKAAAYAGYLPAVYEFGLYLSENDAIESGNYSINSILPYHPEIIRFGDMAYEAYLMGNYKKAFMIYLFLFEFNLPVVTKNFIYLLGKFKSIPQQDIISCDIFMSLAKTDPRYNKDVGDCYFGGLGVKQSYSSAFSSYLSSRKFSEEGAYNTAFMYEYGIGVTRNLYEARRIIEKYIVNEATYLVKVYSLIKINIKILMYHHRILFTSLILTIITWCSFVFKRSY